MWFPSFWELKRRFFSRVLKVPNDIVKSEFMLEPGIITCGLSDCNAVDEIGGSSRAPMHVFHKMIVLIKKLLLGIPRLCIGIRTKETIVV